jgi:hypothetical protein
MLILASDEPTGASGYQDARCGSALVKRSRGNDRPLALPYGTTEPIRHIHMPVRAKGEKSGRRNDRFRSWRLGHYPFQKPAQ